MQGLNITVEHFGSGLPDAEKDCVWRLLCECDGDFMPRLSSRNRPDQRDLRDLGEDGAGTGPHEYFEKILGQEFLIARCDGTFAGFMTYRREEPAMALPELGDAIYVTTVCVEREMRGKGVTSAMYDKVEGDEIRDGGRLAVYTRTWSLNAAQMHTLPKRGYEIVSVLENDRGEGVDTVYFAKQSPLRVREFPFGCTPDRIPSRKYVTAPDHFHSHSSRRFSGIPSIAVSWGGRLWATWYSGPTAGEDSNNYVVLSTSSNGGADWKEVLVADPDCDGPRRSFDPEVWITPEGRLRWMWADREVPLRDGASNSFTCGHYFANTDRLMCVELDAEAEPVADGIVPTEIASGVMMCKPAVLRNGRRLFPVAAWFDDFSARVYEGGSDLARLEPVGSAMLPRERRQFDEHNIVELADGTLRLYMRTKSGPDGAWQSDSGDGGRTWSTSKPCPFAHTNSRLFVRRLASGALLLVKNGPLDSDIGRSDMTAFVSDDDGATWKGGLVLHNGPCSYPDGDQAADGTIFVTFDNDRMGNQEILFAKFTEDDVRAGKKVSEVMDASGVINVASGI